MNREKHDEWIEAGRLLFAGPIAFELGVANLDQLPEANRPEVAFAGRSNVGKSSLVNAVAGRRKLARASTEPGRTRELNFFLVGDSLRLADLPGYGYAKAPKTEIARWTKLTRDYLRGRPSLKRVFLLIDARHGVKEPDREVMTAFDESAVTYQLVLTKADKPKASELAETIATAQSAIAKRPAAHPQIIVTSAETGQGVDVLRAEIAALT